VAVTFGNSRRISQKDNTSLLQNVAIIWVDHFFHISHKNGESEQWFIGVYKMILVRYCYKIIASYTKKTILYFK